MEGFRYVWGRADLRASMVMLFLIGTFGLNFLIYRRSCFRYWMHTRCAVSRLLVVCRRFGVDWCRRFDAHKHD
jgi:hypothetical protein